MRRNDCCLRFRAPPKRPTSWVHSPGRCGCHHTPSGVSAMQHQLLQKPAHLLSAVSGCAPKIVWRITVLVCPPSTPVNFLTRTAPAVWSPARGCRRCRARSGGVHVRRAGGQVRFLNECHTAECQHVVSRTEYPFTIATFHLLPQRWRRRCSVWWTGRLLIRQPSLLHSMAWCRVNGDLTRSACRCAQLCMRRRHSRAF